MAERVALYLQDAHDLRDGLEYVQYAEKAGFEAVWQAESRLVRDRGDGLRGSAPRGRKDGRLAVSHVRVLKRFPLASLCEVRLETGRTHQIRIHLAESGHPLVGERVYIRDFHSAGGRTIPSPRLMLHAASLAFDHPAEKRPVSIESRRTPEFLALVDVIVSGGNSSEV